MRYKQFKNAGVAVSELTVGTWGADSGFWGKVDEQGLINSIRTAIDNGVNIVDTAPAYGDGAGELLVGRALRGGYRDKVLLSTKYGIYHKLQNGEKKLVHDASYANVVRECEDSLRRIGTDHIDFYFLHWPDPSTPMEETMRAIGDLKKQGKVRFAGLSNANSALVAEAEKYMQIDVTQPPYSMVDRHDEAFMKECVAKGIDTVTYGSLGAGILTGAFRKLPDWPEGDARRGFYDMFSEPKFSKVMELLRLMDEIAAGHGRPVVQVALNWSTQKDFVSTAICGFRKPEKAVQNCAAFEWSLTDEETTLLDNKIKELGL